MAQLSRNDMAIRRLINWKKKMREKSRKPKPEIDDKGLYYALKYDIDNGITLDSYKKKKFIELNKKYGGK